MESQSRDSNGNRALLTVEVMLEHKTKRTEIKMEDLGSQRGIQAPAKELYPYMRWDEMGPYYMNEI